jgi:hypothetical protein
VDPSDLAPAKPKRARVATSAPVGGTGAGPSSAAIQDVAPRIDARFDALERAVDARLDALAKTSDALLHEIEDVSRRVGEVALALVKMQASLDGLDPSDIRSDLRLVSDRLSTLVGGPSLGELMDRIDELATRPVSEEPRKRRRTKPVSAGD